MAMRDAGSTAGPDWLEEAKDDIDRWAQVMPRDADGDDIDWRWVRGLDLTGGVGETSAPSAQASAQAAHDALLADQATRARLESLLAQCSTAFMTDFDRILASYRLPRALAYANRRLNDAMRMTVRRGEEAGWWTARTTREGRADVTTLTPVKTGDGGVVVDVSDLRDRTGEILEARAERRKALRARREAGAALASRANLSGMSSPESGTPDAPSDGAAKDARRANANKPDWRDAYLPGRDIDTVMGIDIETTGTDPARDYIIDAGFEFMNMISPRPEGRESAHAYECASYEAGEAYGQARLAFGVPETAARLGNPFIASLTGIDVSARSAAAGWRVFDEWPEAQAGLLRRLVTQPYVAHNATFEHGYFMLTLAGYAEAYRAGDVTIVDTLPMSRQWDPGSEPDEDHPYGDNTLESYARRQGALAEGDKERHLGLEDAHIMLVAMRRHLNALRAEGQGPWGSAGRPGVGGKRCGRRR